MSELISPLLQWLNAHPQLAGLATFLISAAESVAIIGTIVPGTIMMTAIGTLAGAGVIPLWQTIVWAILGAIVGDGISYWFGYYFKDRLVFVWPFSRYPSLLINGEHFFHKYGGMSVFIGRFVGPVRALVPLVAGMLGMRPLIFTIANVTSAIGWAPAYMLPGILLGAASLELPPGIAIHIIMVVLFILLFILLCLWFIYKSLQLIHMKTNEAQNKLWIRLKRSRYLSPATVLLKHHLPEKKHGQLTLAIYFFVACFIFFLLAFYVKLSGPATLTLNQSFFHFFRGIRNQNLDAIMIVITLLGQKQVIFLTIGLLLIFFAYYHRLRVGLHLLALGIVAGGSVFCIKHILRIPRPWGLLENTHSYSMPSGHTTLSTAFYLALAFFITLPFFIKTKRFIYILSIITIFAIGISRLYLGAHWFTDVLSGWILGVAILLAMIISYNRQYEPPPNPFSTLSITIVCITASILILYYNQLDRLQLLYTPLNWPTLEVSANNWWSRNNMMPSYQVSLFGYPTQAVNIEWEGNLSEIRQTLIDQGWSKPPTRDWISTLHRVADVSSTEYLPLISPQYLNKLPALTLSRQTGNGKALLVIRLWESNRIILESKTPIWVGTVGTIPRPYSWIFKYHPDEVEVKPGLVFPATLPANEWQWKILKHDFGKVDKNVLLIKKK